MYIYSLSCRGPFGGAMASRARETRRCGGWRGGGGRGRTDERRLARGKADKMPPSPLPPSRGGRMNPPDTAGETLGVEDHRRRVALVNVARAPPCRAARPYVRV